MHWRGLKLLAALLAAGITYTLLVFFGGSYLVGQGLHKLLAGGSSHNLEIGKVLFNPFTLSARLERLRLNDATGTDILTIDSARLDFSISTLLERRLVLAEVFLEKPEWSLEITTTPADGLARIFAPLSAAGDDGNGVADVRIERGTVREGVVYFREGASQQAGPANAGKPFEMLLSGIDLQIGHYQSISEEPASLEMSATINQSSTLSASGYLVPLTGALETKVQLVGMDLASFSPLLGSNAATGELSGILKADGLLSREADDLHFSGEFGIQGFEARAVWDTPSMFSANEMRVSGAEIDAWPLRASFRFMELSQPQFELGWREIDVATHDFVGIPVLSQWLSGVFGPAEGSVTGNEARAPSWPPAIDAFALTDGLVSLVDPGVARPVRIQLDHVTGGITSHVLDPATAGSRNVNIQLTGTAGESGPLTLASMVQFAGGQVDTRGVIELQQFDAVLLSDYFSGFSAREIVSGKLNLDLRYQVKDDKLAIASMVSLQDFLLGDASGPAESFDLSLDLAVALLTDPLGEISFQFPLLEHKGGSASAVTETISTALAGFVSSIAASPFDVLAELADVGGMALNVVDFEPGSAAITAVAEQQLRALGAALHQRPALGLQATGGHALKADWTELARRQIQLHVALAASTRPSGRPEQAALDLSEPKVQVVLDEFASARLDASELATLKSGRELEGGRDDSTKNAGPEAYYEKVFAALVEKGEVSENALRQLARYRAQSVIRQLETLGIAADRLQFGGTVETNDQPVSMEVFALEKTDASPPQANSVKRIEATDSDRNGYGEFW